MVFAAADKGGIGGHKEINRTTLKMSDIEEGLKKKVVQDQLTLMRLRNTSPAFNGELIIEDTDEHRLYLTWKHRESVATLNADLRNFRFSITHQENPDNETVMSYR